MHDEEFEPAEAVQVIIDGTLDLHMFNPQDVKRLVPDYLEECNKKGIRHVRIIHGKGKGVLRRTVHAILARMPIVVSFKLAQEDAGGWGATLVNLHADRFLVEKEGEVVKK